MFERATKWRGGRFLSCLNTPPSPQGGSLGDIQIFFQIYYVVINFEICLFFSLCRLSVKAGMMGWPSCRILAWWRRRLAWSGGGDNRHNSCFRNLGIWRTQFHPFWMIFCQGWSWDHFLGRWSVKIAKFNDFLLILSETTYFFDLSWGWRRVEKIHKKYIFYFVQKAETMCVLLCAGCRCPRNHGFSKNNIFQYFPLQKSIFAQK